MNTRTTEIPSTPDQPHATTTEELIVQYLDGELVRKELEMVLFERLASSSEARTLLREYLTLRGAIRISHDDDRFQLSANLDIRTRTRIEHMLEEMRVAEPTIAERAPGVSRLAADAEPMVARPATTRLRRFALRPSLAVLALLFTIGTTWFVTRTTTNPRLAMTIAPPPAVTTPSRPSTENSEARIVASTPATSQPSSAAHRSVAEHSTVSERSTGGLRHQDAQPPHDIAQVPQTAAVRENIPAEPPATDDIMLSKRTARILGAAEKHEVVVTSRDRL